MKFSIFPSLIKRELLRFKRNKIQKTLYIGGPLIYGVLFAAIYSAGTVKNLPIVVVDRDKSPLSSTLIDMLEDNETLNVQYVTNDNIDIQQAFITHSLAAAVVIPDNFEGDILQGKRPELNSYINNANLISSGYANRAVSLVTGTLNAVTSAKRGLPPQTVQLNIFRLYNTASNYMVFVWPSFLAAILQSVIMVVVAIGFASEFENDTSRELFNTKLHPFIAAIGKLSAYWILAIPALLINTALIFLFRQSRPVYIPDVLLIWLIFVVTVSLQGMIAGLLIRSSLKALQFLMILIMPAYLSSGFSWPFMYDAWPAQLYGLLFPFMPFVNAFRILFIEHQSLNEVRHFLLLQVIQTFIYAGIAFIVIQVRSRPQQNRNTVITE